MGITSTDIHLIKMALEINPSIKDIIELGSQNLYLDASEKPPFASGYYQNEGLDYTCIDLAGDNNAIRLDLSKELPKPHKRYDLLTDFGTSEHVVINPEYKSHAFHEGHINSVYPVRTPTEDEIFEGYYNCWKNKHNLLSPGGVMINVNPMTGHWEGHGYTYLTTDFYNELAEIMGYDIMFLDEHGAMGNNLSGKNIRCILVKENPYDFISMAMFKRIKTYRA